MSLWMSRWMRPVPWWGARPDSTSERLCAMTGSSRPGGVPGRWERGGGEGVTAPAWPSLPLTPPATVPPTGGASVATRPAATQLSTGGGARVCTAVPAAATAAAVAEVRGRPNLPQRAVYRVFVGCSFC